MKILHLAFYFFPQYSGSTTRLYNVLCRLPSEIRMVVWDRISGTTIIPEKNQTFGNIQVKRVTLEPSGLLNIPPFRYFHTIYYKPRIVANAVKDEYFDIIHAHTALPFGQAGQILARTLGKPLVFELHGVGEENTLGWGRLFDWVYVSRKTREVVRTSDHVVALTRSLKEWICRFYGIPDEKVTVVPNGADIEMFNPNLEYGKKIEELRERLGLKGKVVMYSGYMDKINGIPDLINVIPGVVKEKHEVCFIFIGHGPEESRISSLCQEYPQNVKFLPMVPYSEMPVYYQLCDAYVIPRPSTISAETLIPLKLLEAMAMAKPVLGSDVGGIAEVIKHEENGYLFEKGNVLDFKKSLLEVLDADNSQIGRNARKTIEQGYTWDESARILQKLYEKLA
jgi:glycosyltransferase involved in cell wall biosynthesis